MSKKSAILVTALVMVIAAAIPLFLQHKKIAELEAKRPPTRPVAAASAAKPSVTFAAPTVDNLARLKSILALKDPFQLMRELIDFAGGLKAESIPPLLDYLVQLPGTTRNTNTSMFYFSYQFQSANGPSTNNNQTALSLLIDRLVHLNANGALEWAAKVANRHGREQVIGMVFAAWSYVDPAQALAATDQIDDKFLRESVIGQIAQRLISTNPSAALAALQSLPLNRQYTTIIDQVFASWAGENPQAAVDAAMNLPTNRNRNEAIRSAVQGWALADPAAALAWAGTLPNGDTRISAVNTALNALAQQDPLQAVDYVTNITNLPNRTALMAQVADVWGQDDPKAAMDWILKNSSGPTLYNSLANILDPLSKIDPQAATEALSNFSDVAGMGAYYRGHAVDQISLNWAEQDPQADVAWLKSIEGTFSSTNPNGGPDIGGMYYNTAMRGAVSTWAANDADAASAYVLSLGIDAPQYNQLLGTVATSRFNADPEATLAWIDTLSEDGTRSIAIGTIVRPLAAVDPYQALDLAYQIADGPVQDTAVGNVITAWSSTAPVAAADALSSMPEGNSLTLATQSVATSWIQSDPAAAAAWIGSLPEGDAYNVAARAEVTALISSNPASAFSWGVTIGNPNMQFNQLNGVVQVWAHKDPNAAQAAVQAADLPNDTRAQLLDTIQRNAPQ